MLSADTKRRLEVGLASTAAAAELLSSTGITTFGKIFYVNADSDANSVAKGNDTVHDGLSMDKPFATLSKAYDAVTSNNHDVIIMSGSTAHTITSPLTFSKNRFHIISADPAWSLRQMGQRTRITSAMSTNANKAPITITGVGVTLHGLKITSSDTAATSVFGLADGGEFTILDRCWIEKDTDLDQTGAAELLCNGDTSTYINCTFGNCIYTTSVARQNVLFTRETITGKVARDVMFYGCFFQNRTSATTFVNLRATTNDIERVAYFKECVFWSAKTSSATQAVVAGIASALTDAEILLHGCAVQNITDVCATALGVYTTSPSPSTTGTESVLVALS